MSAYAGQNPPCNDQPYLRFVVGTESENPHRLSGLFTHAEELRVMGRFETYEEDFLSEVFRWFNEHLPCPPFSTMSELGRWTVNAVCWYRTTAREPLARMWDLVALLRECGQPVRLVRTTYPGRIVYSDKFQVVAETYRKMRR